MTRLLIVEPDKYLRDFLTRVFERSGYLVLAATNEIDSLALLAQHMPQAIVLDLFPLRKARTLLSELRQLERTAAIPVIGLIGGDQVSAEQARSLVCDGYVRKPFDLEELLYQVTTLAGMPASSHGSEQINRRRGE
ncbi:MAG TPA: response regulator [Herpetosiphonaceae bacterium]